MRYKLALALFSSILLTAPLALAQGRGSFAAPSRGNSNHHGGDGGFNMFPSPSNQVFAVPAWLTGAGPRPNRNNDFNGRRGNSFGIGYYPAAIGYYPAIYPSYYDGQPNYGPDYTNASQGQIVVLEPRNLNDSQSSREALLERRLDDQARELDRIRQEKNSAPKPDSASAASNDGEELQPTTILVFKDKRNPELVHNYAIVGSNLFVMGRNHRKIPLADLDLPATARANEEAGLEFKMPGTPTAKLHSGLGIER